MARKKQDSVETEIEAAEFGEALERAARSDLLAALVAPCLEFHYLPTRDAALPADRGHILPRAEWLALRDRVERFYKQVSDDDIEVVNHHARRKTQVSEFSLDLESTRRKGYVYVVRSKDGLYYIGICTNLKAKIARIKELARRPIHLFHSWRVLDMRATEARLLRRFEPKRWKGTAWFRLDDAEAAFLAASRDERALGAAAGDCAALGGEEAQETAQNVVLIRAHKYWAVLSEEVSVIKRREAQGAAINRIILDVDKNGWRDEDAFSCLRHMKRAGRGEVSWINAENFLPTYMARGGEGYYDQADATATTGRGQGVRGAQSRGRTDDAVRRDTAAPLKVNRKPGV